MNAAYGDLLWAIHEWLYASTTVKKEQAMARTLSGRMTGRAGAQERAELRAQLYEDELKRRAALQIEAENAAIRRCIALEGEGSFWRWWDGDEVPEYGLRLERIELLEKRIVKHEQMILPMFESQ